LPALLCRPSKRASSGARPATSAADIGWHSWAPACCVTEKAEWLLACSESYTCSGSFFSIHLPLFEIHTAHGGRAISFFPLSSRSLRPTSLAPSRTAARACAGDVGEEVERPPARSPAAGWWSRRRRLGFLGCRGFQWLAALEKRSAAAAVAVRPAAKARRRGSAAGQPR
jgi:hypothetical protein